MKKLIGNTSIFEYIKHIDEYGNEYWYAREFMEALEYNKWENFHKVIKQSKITCKNSNFDVLKHFPEVRKLSNRHNNAKVNIIDYKLSRYA